MIRAPKKEPEKREDHTKALDDVMSVIQEKYGEGALMKLGEVRRVDVDVIPTGAVSLDIALGVRGLPRGRIIEIYGPESSGKTTLALHVVAQAQKKGGKAAFIDAEHGLDPEYAKRIGVNIDDLLISQPDNGEQALGIVETLVKSEAIDVIVVDSVAALTPRVEIEGEMGDQFMGLQARLMGQALRKLTAIAAKTKTAIIFINQIRMQIGTYGNPETTPGGKALKFYSSVRIEIRRSAQIKKGDDIVGNRVKAKVVKNKVAAPFKIAEFDIMYNEGISYDADLINTCMKYGVVKRAGASYTFGEIKLGVGMETAKAYLKEQPSIRKAMLADLEKAVKHGGIVATVVGEPEPVE
ncbi:MAG: Protein RecA [Parcubacteria group bacterium GW2011_GWB1_46_8]|nr:MAG: Protein RecA [Parcubacteria group bacterium GW2011_GWF1_45_5]KKU46382.1 MAG: Protein RecA [Parcubacteria group bacterium GW2011_GWB1_46_8]KKU47953.1 MAG: Protein RecA [Parcubacteria group bacterium GW2011_GWF2_46_8]